MAVLGLTAARSISHTCQPCGMPVVPVRETATLTGGLTGGPQVMSGVLQSAGLRGVPCSIQIASARRTAGTRAGMVSRVTAGKAVARTGRRGAQMVIVGTRTGQAPVGRAQTAGGAVIVCRQIAATVPA